jgi:hypothetical protein
VERMVDVLNEEARTQADLRFFDEHDLYDPVRRFGYTD